MHTKIIVKPLPPRQRHMPKAVAVGLDLSLRGAGIVVLVDGQVHSAEAWTDKKGLQRTYPSILSWFKMAANTEADRQHRIALIAGRVAEVVTGAATIAPITVAIEGYAFNMHQRGHADIHELGGAVKGWLWRNCIPYRTYDPLSIKLAWTGSGNAEKEGMVATSGRLHPRLWNAGLGALAERDVEAAGNIADASLIASLLHEEMELKAGRTRLEDLSASMRRVMIRTTKSEPEALVSRSLIVSDAASPPQPTYATGLEA